MRSFVLLAFAAASLAATLRLTEKDGSSCDLQKYGNTVNSGCDVSTNISSINANSAVIDTLQTAQDELKTAQATIRADLDALVKKFDVFARAEGANNAALRTLISELTVRVAMNEQDHEVDVNALMAAKRAFEAADSRLQDAVDNVAQMQGPKGERGEKGEKGDQGVRGKNGADGARGKDGYVGADGATGATGDKGATGPTGPSGATPVSCTPSDCHKRGVPEGWRHEGCKCTCQRGYKGAACETDIDECAPSPCRNGGTCAQHGVGDYRCTGCNSGFTGTNCETDINECATNPCQNGGECIDKVNAYECRCTTAWKGSRCEISNCKPVSIPLTGCSSSSTYSGGYRCNNALGGNGGAFATRWQRVGGWIKVNVSGRWRVTKIAITFRSANVDHTSATRITGNVGGSYMIGGDYSASANWGVDSSIVADQYVQITAAGVQRGGYNWGARHIYLYGCRI